MENAPEIKINLRTENPANLVLIENFNGTINKKIWDLSRSRTDRRIFTKIDGKEAIGITLEKGDKKEGITERNEISEKKDILIPVDNSIWYGFSVYFPSDFAIVKNRLVFAQWKQKTERDESPFLSFRYVDGKLIFQVNHDDQRVKFEKKIDLRGSWQDILVNYKLGKDDSGFAKSWVNGSLFAEYEGKMGYEAPRDLTYFKMGLYRDELETPQAIYIGSFGRGPTKESVLPVLNKRS